METPNLAHAIRLMDQMSTAMLRFHQHVQRFAELWYRAIEGAYARAHDGRLPGSTRTRRLRKKRRTMVLRWWQEGAR